MKELFGQSLSTTVSESDRIAVAIPGQVAAKNILFSNFWAQLKAIFATNNWTARTFDSSPVIVVFDKKQYILDEAIAPLPFISVDFAIELAANQWLPLGGSSNPASTADMDAATSNITFVSPLRFEYGITTKIFSGLNTSIKTIIGAINSIYNIFTLSKDPTGFVNPELVVVTGNANRTITLTGTVQALWYGAIVPTLIIGYTSPVHGTDITKTYYLSYNGTVVAWNETVWAFDQLQIAIARYDATNAVWYYVRECHGLMNWQTHQNLHDNIGTYKRSGGVISGLTLNSTTVANRRPDISACLIMDEDLPTTLADLTSKLYTQFRLGNAGTDVNTLEAADIVSLLVNNPYYNSFSSPNWVQTLMPNNSVATIWIQARQMAADSASQKYRFEFIQPQWVTQATSGAAGAITTAVDAEKLRVSSELNIGGLANVEAVFIAKIIVVYTGSNWVVRETININGSKFSQSSTPAGPAGTFIHNNLNGLELASSIGASYGHLSKVEYDAIAIKNNYAATTAPAVANDYTQGYSVGSRWIDVTNDNIYDCVDSTTSAAIWVKSNFEVISYALSDYATSLSTGVKDSFHLPYPSKLVELFIAVGEAPTGSILIADIKKNGTTIFTTKPSIDATEKISLTAATPYVLTGAISFIKGDEVISSIDQVGATLTGKGLKAYLIIDRK